MHKTSAWPLAWAYASLIVYASLYPFSDWRDQGIAAWQFLLSPWPQYWTGFDLASNAAGYAPLGFLWALSALRTGRGRAAIAWATLGAGLLSLLMEGLQLYLPARVPSNVDFALNLLGAWLGAVLATLLERLGAISRWSRFRMRWFVPQARGALVLLALWPVALLFPTPIPLGLGQVYERLEASVAAWLEDTPFLDWLPVREVELQPLVPGAEMVCVMLGMLIPCLLGYCVIRDPVRRFVFVSTVVCIGAAATALSSALSYGPANAWVWLGLPAQMGLALAFVLALLLLRLPVRVSAALLVLSLGVDLSIINQASTSAYFAQTLQTWEQGRFIRFHGVVQWLGWAWPYAVLLYVLGHIWAPGAKN